MPDQNRVTKILPFEVVTKGRWAYILWPWTSPTTFLYESLVWGAKYTLRVPPKMSRYFWIEFIPREGTHGEYRSGLFFGNTHWGPRVFRQFNARSSHYLTQHGLDGLPKKLWDAAYEYELGEPVGQAKISFKVATKEACFSMTFWDWMQYFVSGRNGPIRDMAITIMTKEDTKQCTFL